MPIIFDFSLLLVVLAGLTGVIWGLDQLLWRKRRAAGAGEPVLVEYARSFFPIIVIVLLVRSFLFEPFRIPSDSMMPTLLDGDFIFVSKFSYGLRLPVLNVKVVPTGEPARGDVIVFRKPSEPSVNYIKRLVGLPGDRIEVRGDAVWVNGEEMPARDDGLFTEDRCYRNFRQGIERLGAQAHRIMYCPVEPRRYLRGCTTKRDANDCGADPARAAAPAGDVPSAPTGVYIVPAGHYFFMGDNRDNSADSRFPELGYVPEGNLVGKAVRIWLSFNGSAGPAWGRIGKAIR
jgi:signal peptidase I